MEYAEAPAEETVEADAAGARLGEPENPVPSPLLAAAPAVAVAEPAKASAQQAEVYEQVLRAASTSAAWQQQVQGFVDKHCAVFEASEENKLEYTQLHQQYEALVEQALEKVVTGLGV